MKEARVNIAVLKHLQAKGWRVAEVKGLHEHGWDLEMTYGTNGRMFFVESKGDSTAGKESALRTALGQVAVRYAKHPNYSYGIALPASWKHFVLNRLRPDSLRALQLTLFFVDNRGKVEQLRRSKYASARSELKQAA